MMAVVDEQQFCLRWNNFQANITSQFETLRDDEDFTDVTIACEGQRIQAHRVVLSACSPFFKELFKTNPCRHPIIFMRDVEAHHILALMEFMYAGEVNVAQTHLSDFLKTAESLKIRGLTDTSTESNSQTHKNDPLQNTQSVEKLQISSTSTVTSSQDVPDVNTQISSPPTKKLCKSDLDLPRPRQDEHAQLFGNGEGRNQPGKHLQPKIELPEYLSDAEIDEDPRDDNEDDNGGLHGFYGSKDVTELPGGMEIIPHSSGYSRDIKAESVNAGKDSRKLHSLDPRPCEECGKVYSNLSNLRQHMRLIHYPTYVQCNFCHKPFKTDLYLRRHIMSSHGGLNTTFTKASSLNDTKSFGQKFFDVNTLNKNGVRVKYEGNYFKNPT